MFRLWRSHGRLCSFLRWVRSDCRCRPRLFHTARSGRIPRHRCPSSPSRLQGRIAWNHRYQSRCTRLGSRILACTMLRRTRRLRFDRQRRCTSHRRRDSHRRNSRNHTEGRSRLHRCRDLLRNTHDRSIHRVRSLGRDYTRCRPCLLR